MLERVNRAPAMSRVLQTACPSPKKPFHRLRTGIFFLSVCFSSIAVLLIPPLQVDAVNETTPLKGHAYIRCSDYAHTTVQYIWPVATPLPVAVIAHPRLIFAKSLLHSGHCLFPLDANHFVRQTRWKEFLHVLHLRVGSLPSSPTRL